MEIRNKDNGSGVSPAFIKMTFKPFFTARPADQCLALPDDVVRRHVGEIRVDAGPGVITEMLPAEPLPETGDDGIADTLDNSRKHSK